MVFGLHRKLQTEGERGMPKLAADELQIHETGVQGDFNRYRHEELSDELSSAVLVLPFETLEALQAEGWPVRPGDLGENITLRGIAYDTLTPGTVFRAGEVELEVTRACDPCSNLYGLPFVGHVRGPAFLKTMVHRRGWYCRVLHPGAVRVHDPVQILRAHPT